MSLSAGPAPKAAALRRGRHLAFVLTILLVLAGAQELAFRALFRIPEVRGFNRARYQMMAGTNRDLAAVVKQGLGYQRLLFESGPDGFAEYHNLNLYGFRTHDFTIAPPRSGRRVMLLGDSAVEGQGASDSETMAVVLERLLARDRVEAEVLNLGVVAATLDHVTRLARDAIPLLQPTDVILVVNANDLPAPLPRAELANPGSHFPAQILPWWTPRALGLLALASQGEPFYRRWPRPVIPFFPSVPSPTNPWTQAPGPPAGLDDGLYQAMRAGHLNPWLHQQVEAIPGMLTHDFTQGGMPTLFLERIAELCRDGKARLLVVYVPFYAVTSRRYAPALRRLGMEAKVADALAEDPAYRKPNVMLRNVCATLELPLCDTTEALVRAEAAGVPQFWDYDSHPRPAGYATIADAIHEAWKRADAAPRTP